MDAGLCETCVHSRAVIGARSAFWMCERSLADPAFPRYPRLPVLRCRGYEPVSAEPGDAEERDRPREP